MRSRYNINSFFNKQYTICYYLITIFHTVCNPVTAVNWGKAGPDILQSHVIEPLYNQTYPGCWLGSEFYLVGERWSPSIDAHGVMVCVKCQCAQVVKNNRIQMEGRVLCTNIKNECPRTKCASPVLRPNTCCKICPGEDTSFEDQFGAVETRISNNQENEEPLPLQQDLGALLTGGERRGGRPVNTRAVAMVYLTNITKHSFNFAIRYSRLKDPVFFKITDEYGSAIIVRKLPRQTSRTGTIHDIIENIPKDYFQYLLHNNAYVLITSVKHRKGELFGRLQRNTIASSASFEALLNPPDKSGTGALLTMFYDVTTKMASYVIQMNGIRHARPDEYFVTFEKDTEIIHQHLLRLSYQKYQMVGKLEVDGKMSKQIARGRLHTRVTSRFGKTMIGLLRPRLLKSGMIATVSMSNQTLGYVLLTLLDDGTLRYQVSLHLPSRASITLALQRQLKNVTSWKDFAVLLVEPVDGQSLDDIDLNTRYHFEKGGLFKKLRARDIVLIQNTVFRLRVKINEVETYSMMSTTDTNLEFLYQASDILIPSVYCESAAFLFYDLSKDCNTLKYHVLAPGLREHSQHMTFTMETQHAGSQTRKITNPEGVISGINDDVFRDLNHGKVTAQLKVSDEICDLYTGEIVIRNKCWREKYDVSAEREFQENDLEEEGSDTFRCYYEGQFYTHAQSWLPVDGNPCVTCRCNRGNVHCDQEICPSIPCSYPIKRSGECCPVCDDDNDTEMTHSGSCYFEGDKRWHRAGSYWHPYVPPFGYSKCAICNCIHSTLDVKCARIPCPDLACSAEQRVRIQPDDCCQVCRGANDAVMQVNNDILTVLRKGKQGCSFGGRLFEHGDKWHPSLLPFGEMKCYTCTCKDGKSRCKKQTCQQLDCKQQYRPSGECCPICSEKRTRSQKNYDLIG